MYRSELADVLPASVPPLAADVTRDTLGAAVGVADRLPGQVGTALVDGARDAFVLGMRVSTAIATGVAIAIAALAVTMLRNVRSGSEREAAAGAEPVVVVPDTEVVERVAEAVPADR